MSLGVLFARPSSGASSSLIAYLYDVLTLLSDILSDETRSRCIHTLRDHYHIRDPQLLFTFGYSEVAEEERLHLVTRPSLGTELETTAQPFLLRQWEMMQDATPLMGDNDTSLSLTLFGARKSVL